ncbi:hypothetical protein [Amycolatopsis kentuckyensis]|nr:hypothetical protein [Amycolatopsis kentuckyensis]
MRTGPDAYDLRLTMTEAGEALIVELGRDMLRNAVITALGRPPVSS